MVEGRELDVDKFRSRFVDMVYPCIRIDDLNDTTPLLVDFLESGEVPVMATYKGVSKVVCNISLSAYNIDKILRTHNEVFFLKQPGDEVQIRNIQGYLEVLSWIL